MIPSTSVLLKFGLNSLSVLRFPLRAMYYTKISRVVLSCYMQHSELLERKAFQNARHGNYLVNRHFTLRLTQGAVEVDVNWAHCSLHAVQCSQTVHSIRVLCQHLKEIDWKMTIHLYSVHPTRWKNHINVLSLTRRATPPRLTAWKWP